MSNSHVSPLKWHEKLGVVGSVLGIIGFIVWMWGLFPPSSYPPTALNGSARVLWVAAFGVATSVVHAVLWRCAEAKFGWDFSAGGRDEPPTGWQAAVLSATITLPLVIIPPLFQLVSGYELFISIGAHFWAGFGMIVSGVLGHILLYGTRTPYYIGLRNAI
jgi:hypothetical protein